MVFNRLHVGKNQLRAVVAAVSRSAGSAADYNLDFKDIKCPNGSQIVYLSTGDLPKPRFAFQGTINWMRALALRVDDDNFSDELLAGHYHRVQRRVTNELTDTIVFEATLMAFHNLAALQTLNSDVAHHYDTCRTAIISWYYCVYFASRAMIAGCSGASPEHHGSAGRVFQSDIVDNGLLLSPFSPNLTSLVTSATDAAIAIISRRQPT